MSSNFSSFNYNVVLPKECCYCNAAPGPEEYNVTTRFESSSTSLTHTIKIPVCENCLKEIKTKLLIRYILGWLLFFLINGILILITSLTGKWYFLIVMFIFIITYQKIYGSLVINPQRPAVFNEHGKLLFRNKDYQQKYLELNPTLANL